MKRFLPYFALLREVKFKFVMALVAGLLFALVSGLGTPLMIKYAFPLIFQSDGTFESPEVADKPGVKSPTRKLAEALHLGDFGDRFSPTKVRGDLAARYGEKEARKMVLWIACITLPLVAVLRGILGFFNTYLITVCGMHVLVELQAIVYLKLQRLPLKFFSGNRSGDILNRVMGDASILQNTVTSVGNDLIRQPFTLLAALGYLVWDGIENSQSFFILACLASLPIIVMPIRLIGKRLMGRAASMQARAGENISILSETLGATREIRAFNLEELMADRFVKGIRELNRLALKVVRYRYISPPMIEVVAAAVVALALGYSAARGFALERFLAVVVAIYMAYEPIKKLAGVHNRLKVGEVSLNRLEKILEAEETMADPPNPVELKDVRGELVFENVSYAYDGSPALRDISVTIPAGQIVALVGPSGAGKTTFASMVPRFFDPNEGRLTLDGINVLDVRVRDLRQQITLVPQEAILLAGTVEENIRLGRMGATEAEVVEAARQANADAFIRSKEHGYATEVGERGVQLSGGQKQRISIARAFLKDAPVLILDEATAALDSETEAQIQNELALLAKGRTTLIIAHRFSSIKIAHRILVFDDGRIVGDGTFEELAESHELFKLLLKRQRH